MYQHVACWLLLHEPSFVPAVEMVSLYRCTWYHERRRDPMAAESARAILEHLRSQGALKRAYAPLRETLPELLLGANSGTRGVHGLILASLRTLLNPMPAGEVWPGSSAPGYCALLLDAAEKIRVRTPPTAEDCAEAEELCTLHPNFFRKIAAVYFERSEAMTGTAALRAAQTLWERGDGAEVAWLVADYALHNHFDTSAILRSALDMEKPHAVPDPD